MVEEFDKRELLDLLEMVNQRVKLHHDALWKEEVHYTWLSYIIVGGLISILYISSQNNMGILTAFGFFFAGIFLSFMGFLISLIGFRVTRLEGEYFHKMVQISNRLNNKLKENFDNGSIFPDDEYGVVCWDQVIANANRGINKLVSTEVIKYLIRPNLSGYGIRDLFQITMLLPTFIFISGFVYSIIAIVCFLTAK